jgi:hypothetical protein
MAQIAVTIIDPSNNRSAHLVETQIAVREVIPPVVKRLKLPERASYQLFPVGSENALPADRTLAENFVPAGAELALRPVRNQILKAILDKLYEDAQGYIEEQAWELAKEKLQEVFRLDPNYPDVRGLERVVAAQAGALRSGTRTQGMGQRSQPAPAGRPTGGSTSGTNFSSTAATGTTSSSTVSSSGSGAYQLAPQAAKSSGASCIGIVLLVAGVVVAGGIALAGAAIFLPGMLNNLAANLGISLPGTVVLGTGDVQVTLRWEGEADLDLHVVDPNGELIWFGNDQSASGGILDVDANGACEGLAQPVENIYWPTGVAPTGEYAVSVVYYQTCGHSAPVDYEVTITIDGNIADRINAQITNEGEQHPVSTFQY